MADDGNCGVLPFPQPPLRWWILYEQKPGIWQGAVVTGEALSEVRCRTQTGDIIDVLTEIGRGAHVGLPVHLFPHPAQGHASGWL